MNYKKCIIELLDKVEDNKKLKRIYCFINRIFVKGE
jgi:hypothetical protein